MTPPEYEPLDSTAVREIIERGESTPFEKEYIRKDGSRVPIFLGAVRLTQDPLEWACFIVDLSAQRRAEAELGRALDQVEALIAQKQTLLDELAHRRKNDLQLSKSLLSLQARRTRNTEAKRVLEDAAARIAMLAAAQRKIDDLGFARAIAMNSWLPGFIEEVAVQCGIEPRDLSISVEGEISVPSYLAKSVAILVNELLTNVAKHAHGGPAGTHVQISLTRRDSILRLVVHDDGPGLAEGFDVRHSGGLGLTLCDRLAQQHGGALTVDKVARGAQFVVQLDLAHIA